MINATEFRTDLILAHRKCYGYFNTIESTACRQTNGIFHFLAHVRLSESALSLKDTCPSVCET